jgi:hypothetical protein
MESISRTVFTAGAILMMSALGAAIAFAAHQSGNSGAAAKPLPNGPGKVVMEQTCVGCHSLSVVTTKRATPAEWTSLVQLMVSHGATGSDRDIDTLTHYLAKNFGPGAPRYALPTIPKLPETMITAATAPALLSADEESAEEIGANSVALIYVNVNQAGPKKLESVLLLTPEEAQTLIQYREKNGNFQNWQQVGEIPGVPAGKIIQYRNRLLF